MLTDVQPLFSDNPTSAGCAGALLATPGGSRANFHLFYCLIQFHLKSKKIT